LGYELTGSKARTRTVTWQDPPAALPAAAGVSALELMKAVVEGRLPPPPMMETMHTAEAGPVRREGVVVHRGGRVGTAEGKLPAHGTTTCLVILK